MTSTSDAPHSDWLVLVGSDRLDPATSGRVAELARSGASLIGWEHPPIAQDGFPSPPVTRRLQEQGLPARSAADALGDAAMRIEDAVIDWFRALARRPLGDLESLWRWLRCDGLTLWWWIELYLYHSTPLRLYVRDVEVLHALLAAGQPARLVLVAPPRALEDAARRLAECPVEILAGGEPAPRAGVAGRAVAAALKAWGTASKRPFVARAANRAPILLLTHASMWRSAAQGDEPPRLEEHYLQPLMDELTRRGVAWQAVAAGPSLPFRRRSRAHALREMLSLGARAPRPYRPLGAFTDLRVAARTTLALRRCWGLWRDLASSSQASDLLEHRGVSLRQPGRAAFREALLLQGPWAVRSYHELRNALRACRPEVLGLYAESSGLGRAAVAAARAEGVASFATQHGIMYPQYFSHEHAPEDVCGDDGCPLPDRTALFGELARQLLITRGHHPEERLVVTGSPRFDRLVETASHFDAAATRRREGVPEDARLLVLATRFTALGNAFEALVRSCQAQSEVWLLVKPHPAESTQPYLDVVARLGAHRCSLAEVHADLLELLHASDGLVTVDSFASAEALVLGRPVLVLNLPNHLDALVEHGAALGVHGLEDLPERLESFVRNPQTAEELARRGREYLSLFASGADGGSTRRLVDALLAMRRQPQPASPGTATT